VENVAPSYMAAMENKGVFGNARKKGSVVASTMAVQVRLQATEYGRPLCPQSLQGVVICTALVRTSVLGLATWAPAAALGSVRCH